MNPTPRTPAPGVTALAALVATLVGVLLWAHLAAGPYRLGSGLLDARTQLEDAEKALSRGRRKPARFATLEGSAAARRAETAYRGTTPLLDVLGGLPSLGPPLEQVGGLVSAVSHSAAAAEGTLTIAESALKGPDRIVLKDAREKRGGSRFRLGRVRAVGKLIANVRADVRAAGRALASIDRSALPRRFRPALARALESARANDRVLADAEAGFAVLPGILGADEPRRYLLGMQNSAELRGTGGAMLRFAVFSIDRGRLDLEPDQSVYDLDVNRRPLDIPLPADAWYVRDIEDAQRFGNANWSPDWPLSARITLDYAKASERLLGLAEALPPIDGFFAIDPVVMQQTLPGVGGFKTRGGRRVNAAKVVNLVLNRAYAATPRPGVRRAALKGIVKGFYRNLLRPRRPTGVIEGFGKSLTQKHMQIWMRDPQEEAFIERMGWDGAIADADDSGYLDVVQQNVGGNKLDFFADMTTDMRVEPAGSAVRVSAEVSIHNGTFLPQPRYVLGDVGRAAETLTRGWALHRPMINLYAPRGAVLEGVRIDGNRIDHPVPAIWPTSDRPAEHLERGKRVWSATLEIPVGETASAGFDYRVPGTIHSSGDRSIYRLALQHQPKVRPETTTVRFVLPSGARKVKAKGFDRRGDELVWTRAVRRDTVLEVSWFS